MAMQAHSITNETGTSADRYPLAMRGVHWLRALIIFGQIAVGLTMVSLPDSAPVKFGVLYPFHKSFGLLVLALTFLQVALRAISTVPPLPAGLPKAEAWLSKLVKSAIYGLMLLVPAMGYAMSSTYTQSDGVTFFGLPVPELLPKNDHAFEIFRLTHKVLAYTLLALVCLHVAGALKHRFVDRDKTNDVLRRML
jgi:cytochrome b561